jgi:integrase
LELTEREIRRLLEGEASRVPGKLADSAEPNLSLEFGPGNARWSVLAMDAEGGCIQIPIGNWPGTSLEAARKQARRLWDAMLPTVDAGEDISVGRLLDLYEHRRLSQLRKGKAIRRALDGALSGFFHREACTLGRREIGMTVDRIADRAPVHANRMLAYTKAFFGWAVGRGYLESNPAGGISKPTREITRERTPSLPELVEIWGATDDLGYPFGPIIKLLILTAARRDEIGAMRAAEIDLAPDRGAGCWTLPASRSKSGRAIRVPLCDAAANILRQAIAERPDQGPFIFSTTGVTAVSGWSKAKGRLDKSIATRRLSIGVAEPIEPWRFHDLRRSFATHACDLLEIDPAVADRCLNHVGASTTTAVSRVYARNEMFSQRREALTKWADLLAAAIREEE